MNHESSRAGRHTKSDRHHSNLSPKPSSSAQAAVGDEEARQFQTAFSNMIDHTCEDGATGDDNIFQHTYVPSDWYSSFFRSIVPSQDVITKNFEDDQPKQPFAFDGDEGTKYTFKVFDRRTGRLIFEQMPPYHRFAMRLLFGGPVQRELLNRDTTRNFFARETLRLGKSFDDPKSIKNIPGFIKTYQIRLDELLKPNIKDYATFNEFFYRKLKPNARPIANPSDPNIIVSAADCRLMIFKDISSATRLWIKGQDFSLENLFSNATLAEEFNGGSIAVFRLAPVDYHRFHSPINGKIGARLRQIPGTYYTVNPVAIRENLDVLTENQRTLITIENQVFEKVAFVAIGALLVGSVNFTVQPGDNVAKGDELGYFAYGGSTVVVVFKAGMVKWDEDLHHNSDNSMETLVRVGERIGQRTTEEEREEYLAYYAKFGKKNATLNNLFGSFPTAKNAK